MNLSTRVLRVLTTAGWYSGRHVDFSEPAARLAAEGISFHDLARRFLSEFHGLELHVRLSDGRDQRIRFDVVRAFEAYHDVIVEPAQRDHLDHLAEGPVAMVGLTDDFLLLMRDDG